LWRIITPFLLKKPLNHQLGFFPFLRGNIPQQRDRELLNQNGFFIPNL
jgi:hypothetical protein